MPKGAGHNLKAVLTALFNLMGSLFRRHPIFFLVLAYLIGTGLMLFTETKNKMEFGLCILITFVSVIIYVQTKKYAETMLSFMIGILTIFTINWDGNNSKMFIVFYIGINVLFFFLNSISLATKIETELTHAASYIDTNNFKLIYDELHSIASKSTKYNQLNSIDKSEIIKKLAYARIETNQMYLSIVHIEMIKVVFGLSISEAFEFYKNIHYVVLRSTNYIDISLYIETILLKALPISPSEFIEIFNMTKKHLISGKLDLDAYLCNIEDCLFRGYSIEEIIVEFNS